MCSVWAWSIYEHRPVRQHPPLLHGHRALAPGDPAHAPLASGRGALSCALTARPRAPVGTRHHVHVPSSALGDGLHDGEAESGPAAVAFGGEEALKQLGLIGGRDAASWSMTSIRKRSPALPKRNVTGRSSPWRTALSSRLLSTQCRCASARGVLGLRCVVPSAWNRGKASSASLGAGDLGEDGALPRGRRQSRRAPRETSSFPTCTPNRVSPLSVGGRDGIVS